MKKFLFIYALSCSSFAGAYTANKVWFEFLPSGQYRVFVNYTVPGLREFREAYIDFASKPKAESFYWDVVKGGDFYVPDPEKRRFNANKTEPNPW